MKKFIILCFLLLPSIILAQIEFLGTVTVDTIRYNWGDTFELLKKLPSGLKTKSGAEVIFIPTKKVYNRAPRYAMLFDGVYYSLFTYDSKTATVTLERPETYLVEFNLKTKMLGKEIKYINDTYDVLRPADLTTKIADEMKKRPEPIATPGVIEP